MENKSITIYDKYGTVIKDKISYSLSLFSNNKTSTIRLDNLKQHSGYMQYYLLKSMDTEYDIQIDEYDDTFNKKSTSSVTNLNPDNTPSNPDEKTELHKKIHNETQNIMKEIIHDTYKLIHENPKTSQAQICQLSGFTKSLLNDNNRCFVTVLDIMNENNMIKKTKSGRNVIFECIEDKEYTPTPYIDKTTMKANKSKLEAFVAQILISSNIEFREQVTKPGCKHVKDLRFDFEVYLPNGDEILIEVDGRQHYEYVPHFHRSYEKYEECILRDEIKNKYVKDNDLTLLRMRYDDNIYECMRIKFTDHDPNIVLKI